MNPFDLPPRRRPMPVLIATVFLAVVAGAAGLVLGDRARQPSSSATSDPTPTPTVSSPSVPVAPRSSAPQRGFGPPVEVVRRRAACRDETQLMAKKAGARGRVYTVVQFENELGSVWICADTRGRLFYHLWRNVDGEFWVEGDSALFVADPTPRDDGYDAEYVDGDGSIPMSVGPVELSIKRPEGYTEVLPTLRIRRWVAS